MPSRTHSRFFFSLLFWLIGCAAAPLAGVAQAAPRDSTAADSIHAPPTYRFIITRLPANTPGDAAFYLVGSFNNWQPADTRYRFRQQPNGLFCLVLRTTQARLEYKVSRGSWAAIEGSGHGQVRANRVTTRQQARAGELEVSVQSWEDLAGTFQFYSLYDLLLLFSCLQGLLLLVAIPSTQHANRVANRWLLWLLGLGALAALLTVVSGYREAANAYPKLTLLPDFIWFLYGPLFYCYLRRLLFNEAQPPRQWLYLLPAGLQLLVYLPYFLLDSYEFQLKLVSHDATLRAVLLATGAAAWLSNGAYWMACRRTLRDYTRQYEASVSYEQNMQYLGTVLGIQAACLALWGFLFVLVLTSRWVEFDVYSLATRNVELIWLTFSTLPYFLGYVAIRQPEIFKLVPAAPVDRPDILEPALPLPVAAWAAPLGPTPVEAPRPSTARSPLALDQAALYTTVTDHMQQHKPYLNPNLTIHELATGLKLPPHVLSKVINEGFEKNFFDFINSYRIEEFKAMMATPRAQHYSLLGVALEVGFNSKTAFNRAFKKQTDQTPRQYFNGVSEE